MFLSGYKITYEEFIFRWPNVNTPEDVDFTFGLEFLDKSLQYTKKSFNYDAWIREIPEKFYEMAEEVIDEALQCECDTKQEFVVKVYEQLLIRFKNPSVYFEVMNGRVEEEIVEDIAQKNWYNDLSGKLPKHIVDILSICGDYVVKPSGKNSFTYLNVDDLAQEIQSIFDEYKGI